MSKRKTEQDYNKVANQRGFKWIGPLPKSNQEKSLWECPNSHRWLASYSNIRRGSGCPHCYGNYPKDGRDYFLLAQKANLAWMGQSLPKNIFTSTLWECLECNYQWKAKYNNIQQGKGCPNCAGLVRKVVQDYTDLAQEKGLKWVGKDKPQNTHTKTLWHCQNEHTWNACYDKIRIDRGCPYCVNIINGVMASKAQLKIAKRLSLEKYVNYQFDSSKRRIDIAMPWKKIAIEYDSWYWHASKLEYDRKRAQDLIDLGWCVLSIKSSRKISSKDVLIACIKQLDETNYIELILDDWGKGDYRTQKG